jgi:hypothetical protein
MKNALTIIIVVHILVICIFSCLGEEHIYPKNKTVLDPCKMMLPMFPEKAATTCAKCIVFVVGVIVLFVTSFMDMT